MQYNKLGKTDLEVSQICFGALGIGPLQANLPLDEGAAVIRYALDCGLNFIDTAELYNTYSYIKKAISGINKQVIIATKSYAYSKDMMKKSFENARKSLNRDYIDIFLLHEQESYLTIKGHWEAFEFLLELKAKKLIKAVGISTHHISAVNAAIQIPEIDVIHPLINIAGLGIADGSREAMETAIRHALEVGKGVYSMKALGGGNLISNSDHALAYAFSIPVHAVALGMKTSAEVDYNISYAEKKEVSEEIRNKVNNQARSLLIEDWCKSCGKCVLRCSQKALTLTEKGIVIDKEKCVLCGYCAGECADFCIKIF